MSEQPPFDPDPQSDSQSDPLAPARAELQKALDGKRKRKAASAEPAAQDEPAEPAQEAADPAPATSAAKSRRKSAKQTAQDKQAKKDKDDILRALFDRGCDVARKLARAIGMADRTFEAIVAEREAELEAERIKLAEEQAALARAKDPAPGAETGDGAGGKEPPQDPPAGSGEGDDEDAIPEWRLMKNPVKRLPKDCPVEPLGRGADGMTFYYLNPDRQLVELGSRHHNSDDLMSLFSTTAATEWVFRNYPKFNANTMIQTGYDSSALQRSLKTACGALGVLYPAEQLRGVGAWLGDNGELVWHCGDAVWIGGKWQKPGLIQEFIYTADRARPRPHKNTGEDAVVRGIEKIFNTWNWVLTNDGMQGKLPDGRTIQGVIMTAYTACAMVGGALSWRPMIWLTGDYGGGKSTLLQFVGDIMGGDMVKAGNATAAGVWTAVGHSTRPVLLDEVENDPNSQKNRALVELARVAASGDDILRGSSNHTGAQFQARSCFLLSSIIHCALPGQDISRFCVFDLSKMKGRGVLKYDKKDVALAGAIMRARIARNWPRWEETLAGWMGTLADMGHASREQKQYGTLLAMYDMVSGFEMFDTDSRQELCAFFSIDDAADTNTQDMLTYLRTKMLNNVYRGGNRENIGALVRKATRLDLFDEPKSEDAGWQTARDTLAAYGLGIDGSGPEARIYFPNSSEGLRELFNGSWWHSEPGTQGVWQQALRRMQPESRSVNSSKWGGRCWHIPARLFLAMDAQELDEFNRRTNKQEWAMPDAGA